MTVLSALGLAEFCHAFLKGDDQIFGVHMLISNTVVSD